LEWHKTLAQQFPELFSFARFPSATFSDTVNRTDFLQNFSLPLSIQAHDQLLDLQNHITNRTASDASDIWSYSWGNCNFSTAKAYKVLVGQNLLILHLYGPGAQSVK
jgi:hypothetical protein